MKNISVLEISHINFIFQFAFSTDVLKYVLVTLQFFLIITDCSFQQGRNHVTKVGSQSGKDHIDGAKLPKFERKEKKE